MQKAEEEKRRKEELHRLSDEHVASIEYLRRREKMLKAEYAGYLDQAEVLYS